MASVVAVARDIRGQVPAGISAGSGGGMHTHIITEIAKVVACCERLDLASDLDDLQIFRVASDCMNAVRGIHHGVYVGMRSSII
jgi:hypothetical protein